MASAPDRARTGASVRDAGEASAAPADVVAKETVTVFAAGSLDPALRSVADRFGEADAGPVELRFGPSGLLRRSIETGATAHLFASADMGHPKRLADGGLARKMYAFAGNRLCALARPGLNVDSGGLLDALLDPAVRVGMSTPGADPSGDYALALFDRADGLSPGAGATLRSKARQVTGGAGSRPPPTGRNVYAWALGEYSLDVFLTYRTNVLLAQTDTPGLRRIDLPESLAVGAVYGLAVLNDAPARALALAGAICAPDGQRILEGYGFTPAVS